MKKQLTILGVISLFVVTVSFAELGLTNNEIVSGLKSALNIGADKAIAKLGASNGYYADAAVKILLPPEAQNVYKNINKVPGGTKMLEKAVKSLNSAAEDAATTAKPIFIDAIKGITITDGLNILKGSNTAATTMLFEKTHKQILTAFTPKIDQSLSKNLAGGVSANTAYTNLVKAYNTASLNGKLFSKIKTGSLSQHVALKAMEGMFRKIADEEVAIRKNPQASATDLLKKVFGGKW